MTVVKEERKAMCLMNREETKKILMGISCSYPNFKPQVPMEFMVDIWTDDLADYTYEQIYMALKTYKSTDNSGFAPSVGQLIDKLHSMKEMNEISENEAWDMVRRAIADSTYHAEEHFEKFSEEMQRAVGSPNNLRMIGGNENYNEDVEKALFLKSYQREINRKKNLARLPEDVKRFAIEQTDKMRIAEKTF